MRYRCFVAFLGSGDCPTEVPGVANLKARTERLIPTDREAQSPWRRSPDRRDRGDVISNRKNALGKKRKSHRKDNLVSLKRTGPRRLLYTVTSNRSLRSDL